MLNSSATALSSAGCEAPSLARNSPRWKSAFQTPETPSRRTIRSFKFKETSWDRKTCGKGTLLVTTAFKRLSELYQAQFFSIIRCVVLIKGGREST